MTPTVPPSVTPQRIPTVHMDAVPCPQYTVLPLVPLPAALAAVPPVELARHIPAGFHVWRRPLHPRPFWRVGTLLSPVGDPALPPAPLFRVVGRLLLPVPTLAHALSCPLLQALVPLPQAATVPLTAQRKGRSLAWITLSDKGYAGEREDLSGPAIGEAVSAHVPLCWQQGFLLPDDAASLKALLVELALGQGYDLIVTTGGTGIGPRDISPEATLAVLEKRLPGFEQAMMAASCSKTPHAIISRAVAGTLGHSIIVNTPGSRRAVVENLQAILPALTHALDKLHGDPADCGG